MREESRLAGCKRAAVLTGESVESGRTIGHPAVIAGGGGRTLELGRYLRLRNIDSDERVPHNKLLVSLAHAVGQTQINYFGDRDLRSRAEYQGPLVPLML
jgi:hypothetical protein